MNIFALDRSPYLSAVYHCDKHVVKMILETAQLLCTAHHILDGDVSPLRNILYKPTHKNHPSAIWVRESFDNYMWAVNLFECLHSEWQHRWGHSHDHKSYQRLMYHNPETAYGATIQWAPLHIPRGPLTEFKLCMPDQYKIPGDPVQSYRDYYVGAKSSMLKYTKRARPFWLDDVENHQGVQA